MSRIFITIQGNRLAAEYDYITSGNVETVLCEFEFDESWEGYSKTAVFFQKVDNTLKRVLGTDGTECTVPWEALSEDKPLYIGLYGTQGNERKTTSFGTVRLVEGSYNESTAPPDPTPDIYAQLLDLVEDYRQDNADNAAAAKASEDKAKLSEQHAEQSKLSAAQSVIQASGHAQNAGISAASALESKGIAIQAAGSAEGSKMAAAQALSDLLNMLGISVATLINGKLTPSQIPAIAVTDTFVVSSEAAMLALDAQTGDVCIRTDESRTYILQGDAASELNSWKHMVSPTNYADEAGHAATADEAVNATKINNKRIIGMTQSQYDGAVLDENTFYFVTPD